MNPILTHPQGRFAALSIVALIAVAIALLMNATGTRAVSVDTRADATISADTAANAASPSPTAVQFTFTPSGSFNDGATISVGMPAGWSMLYAGFSAGDSTCYLNWNWEYTSSVATATVSTEGQCGPSDPITVLLDVQPNDGATTVTGNLSLALSGGISESDDNVGTLTITPGAATVLKLTAPDLGEIADQNVGVPFDLRIRALDQFGNVATSFVSNITLASWDGAVSPAFTGGGSIGPMVAGELTPAVTFDATHSSVQFQAWYNLGEGLGMTNYFAVGLGPISTTTTLTDAPDPSRFGETATLTATVTSGDSSIPDGTVTFWTGGLNLGSRDLDEFGVASLQVNVWNVGSRPIHAVFSGTNPYTTSTSEEGTHTVIAGDTSSTVEAPQSAALNTAVALTATVVATSPAVGTPTGTVTFYDGATLLGTAELANGTATFNASFAVTGDHVITVQYAGDGNFNSSVSPSDTLNVVVDASAITLTDTPDPSYIGQTFTLTATVVPDSSQTREPASPTGSVTFWSGETNLGTEELDEFGVASLQLNDWSVGVRPIHAVYDGSDVYGSSTSAQGTHTVIAGDTSSTVEAPAVVAVGAEVALTATVTVTSPAVGTPTGTVSFYDGAVLLGTAALSGGHATINTTFTVVGEHVITAVYSGDAQFISSTSPMDVVDVVLNGTTLTLTGTPETSVQGTMVTLTGTLGPLDATGTVRFTVGLATIGTATIVDGVATFTTTQLGAGFHTVVATYVGDEEHTSAASNGVTLTVTAPPVTDPGTPVVSEGTPSPTTTVPTTTPAATGTPGNSTATPVVPTQPAMGPDTLSEGIAAGAMSLITNSTTDFKIGDRIVINPGGATEEFVIVASLDPLTFTSAVLHAHLAGEQVFLVAISNEPVATPRPPATGSSSASGSGSASMFLVVAGLIALVIAGGTSATMLRKSS